MDSAIGTLGALFGRRWWWVTIVVALGVVALVWLGIWQLDRLDERRAFNASVSARWQEMPLDLNIEALPDDASLLEYRRVTVAGEYDYDNQLFLTNQSLGAGSGSGLGGAPGVYLVTPLVYEDGQAALVVRGWVPMDEAEPEIVSNHNESATEGIVGLMQESQTMPNGQPVVIPTEAQREWNFISIDAIQPQMPYELLPYFILQLPEEGRSFTELPLRVEPIRLTEGSHFSYAIQWFMFATILGIGYILFVRYSEQRAARIAAAEADAEKLDSDLTAAQPGAS